MENRIFKEIIKRGYLVYLLGIFLFLNFSQLSCKQAPSQNANAINIVEKALVQEKNNDKDHLLDFVLSTSFDFNPHTKNQIRALLDNIKNKVALVKIYVETDGTGTLGWLKIDFENEKVYDVTIDPEDPQTLTFNHQKFVVLKNNLIGKQTSLKDRQPQNSRKNVLIKWDPTNSLLEEKLDSKQIILKGGFNQNNDLFIYKLSSDKKDYNPLILSECFQSGHCEEFLLTTDATGNEISRLKIYYNTAPDGNEENYSNCIYEIYTDFTIKLSLAEYLNGKVTKKEKWYKISEAGNIEKVDSKGN